MILTSFPYSSIKLSKKGNARAIYFVSNGSNLVGMVAISSVSMYETFLGDVGKRIVRLVIFNAGKGFKRNVFSFGGDRQDYEVPQSAPKQDSILLCSDCGNPISAREHDYSVKHYGTQLCRDCQQRNKR